MAKQGHGAVSWDSIDSIFESLVIEGFSKLGCFDLPGGFRFHRLLDFYYISEKTFYTYKTYIHYLYVYDKYINTFYALLRTKLLSMA